VGTVSRRAAERRQPLGRVSSNGYFRSASRAFESRNIADGSRPVGDESRSLRSQPRPLGSQPRSLRSQPRLLRYRRGSLGSQPRLLRYRRGSVGSQTCSLGSRTRPLRSQPRLLGSRTRPLRSQPRLLRYRRGSLGSRTRLLGSEGARFVPNRDGARTRRAGEAPYGDPERTSPKMHPSLGPTLPSHRKYWRYQSLS
jgi:hypothetical protein